MAIFSLKSYKIKRKQIVFVLMIGWDNLNSITDDTKTNERVLYDRIYYSKARENTASLTLSVDKKVFNSFKVYEIRIFIFILKHLTKKMYGYKRLNKADVQKRKFIQNA